MNLMINYAYYFISHVYDATGRLLRTNYPIGINVGPGVVGPLGKGGDVELQGGGLVGPVVPPHIYDDGRKDYCGNIIYENSSVKQILFDGGYITFSSGAPVYHYYLQDHLGNNRVVVKQDGTIEQVNHYYPFGGLFGESTNGDVQRFKYNGKELERMHGLDWYDYGARHLDAALGRWSTVDPMAEKYYHLSPYNYCGNNPIKFVDPDGRKIYVDEKSREQVLEWINMLSKDQYKIDKDGYLYLDGSTSELYHSQYYSDRINAAIDNDNIISIQISDYYGGHNISKKGEGLTLISGKDNANVVLTGNTNYSLQDTEGGSLYCGPEYILAHELVGHAIPYTTPSIYNDNRDTGYAIDSENIVRSETNSKLRAIDEYSRTDFSFPSSHVYDIPWKGNRIHKRTMRIRSFNGAGGKVRG